MNLENYLQVVAKHDGSDLYLSTGAPPSAKFHGTLKPLAKDPLKPDEIMAMAKSIMDPSQKEEFERELELNLAISLPGIGRFRVNLFQQRNQVSMVARNIKMEIPNFSDLKLPATLKELIMAKRGLLLFVGATGSGKSTSLASLIDLRNSQSAGHIITIEDPVEFVHQHKRSIINQREVGVDTRSFHNALKNALRQAPDVILIGEIRDRETMEHCISYAETGHLAISTLHANNANQALDRIINFFPEDRREQLLHDLSLNLVGICSQRLVPSSDQKRTAAVEIMLATPVIKDLIARGHLSEIKEIMEKTQNQGNQTFDSSLFQLVMEGRVSEAEALRHADSNNNLRLKLKIAKNDQSRINGNTGHWSLQ